MVGANDGSHQVASECRTGLLDALGLGVNFQLGAVCCQTGIALHSQAGTQVTADMGSTQEHNLRLILGNGLIDNLGISVGGVVSQLRCIRIVYLVSAIFKELVRKALHIASAQNSAQLAAHCLG